MNWKRFFFDYDDVRDVVRDPFDCDEVDTHPCPSCCVQIPENLAHCPHCGYYISADELPAAPKPWWIAAGVIGGLAYLLWWLFK